MGAENNKQDLRELLLAGHSKVQAERIIAYVGNDSKRYKELTEIFLNGEKRLSQLASWPFSYSSIENPKLIKPYFPLLIKKLKEENNHTAIYRNTLRAFEAVDIPEKYQSEILDLCISFFTSELQAIAVRAFAVTVASKIAMPFPDLKKELAILLNDVIKHPQAPAISVRVKRAIKACNQ